MIRIPDIFPGRIRDPKDNPDPFSRIRVNLRIKSGSVIRIPDVYPGGKKDPEGSPSVNYFWGVIGWNQIPLKLLSFRINLASVIQNSG